MKLHEAPPECTSFTLYLSKPPVEPFPLSDSYLAQQALSQPELLSRPMNADRQTKCDAQNLWVLRHASDCGVVSISHSDECIKLQCFTIIRSVLLSQNPFQESHFLASEWASGSMDPAWAVAERHVVCGTWNTCSEPSAGQAEVIQTHKINQLK